MELDISERSQVFGILGWLMDPVHQCLNPRFFKKNHV